ncbi:S-layer homology domain-containing protein, partial [Paenibacillus ferrarius]
MGKKGKQLLACMLAVLLMIGLLADGSGGKAYAAGGYTITSIAGTGKAGFSGDGGVATSAQLGGLPAIALPGQDADASGGMVTDSKGNLYIADSNNHRVRKIATDGTISTVSGMGGAGYSGDGGLAASAKLNSPRGLAVDSGDNLYIADAGNNRIRKVDTYGRIYTVAGDGTSMWSQDGKAATSVSLSNPRGLAVDSTGNLYIAEYGNNLIRKVDTSGKISTVAGTMNQYGQGQKGFGGDTLPATKALLNHPSGVGFDNFGTMYIFDEGNRRIRRVDAGGLIWTEAGGGSEHGSTLEGKTAINVDLPAPRGMTVDGKGNLYVADYFNHRILKIDETYRKISIIAGTGIRGYSGDGGEAKTAQLENPNAMALDKNGNLYVEDAMGTRVRKLTAPAVDPGTGGGGAALDCGYCVVTVAGVGVAGYSGDGNEAIKAKLQQPYGVAADRDGNLYIADTYNSVIRKVDKKTKNISTILGNGQLKLSKPYGVSVDQSDNLYIADSNNHRILKLTMVDGTVSTVAGTSGAQGSSGDSGPAISAKLNNPKSVAIDKSGNLYIADADNYRIRKVDTSGNISTVAGNGQRGSSGNGGAATLAQLNWPVGVAVDSAGNLYIADDDSTIAGGRVQKVDKNGNISTVTQVYEPLGVAVDSAGSLYIASRGGTILKANGSGSVLTVAGGGCCAGSETDGVKPLKASLPFPNAVAVDGEGNLYVASNNNWVRKVVAPRPAYSLSVSQPAGSPVVGVDQAIKLAVMDEAEQTDLNFKDGSYDVTISGYTAAPDGSYGSLNGIELNAGTTTVSGVPFVKGVATVNLRLNKAGSVPVVFSMEAVKKPSPKISFWQKAGSPASLALKTDLAAPDNNGGMFAQQPIIAVNDAYGNWISNDSSTEVIASKKDTGLWTLTGSTTRKAQDGILSFADLGAVNADEVVGAQLALTSSGWPGLTSASVNLPKPTPAHTVSATAAAASPEAGKDNLVTLTVRSSQGDTDTAFNGAREVTISGYAAAPDGSYGSLGGNALTVTSSTYSAMFADGIATVQLQLNQAAKQSISLSVAGVVTPAANVLSITPQAGSPASLALTKDLTAPTRNGGLFAQQPVVTLRDTFGNTSVGDSSTVVTVSKKDAGDWTLTGATAATASSGIVAFTGLGAANDDEVTGAQLAFDAAGLPGVSSAAVTLPEPGAAFLNLKVAASGDSHVLLAWEEVYGTVSYAVYQRTASGTYGAPAATVSGSVYGYDASELTNGTTYSFIVKATNRKGAVVTSNEVSATPGAIPAVPSAPTAVTATAGNGQAIVSFAIPAVNGGSAITKYEVTALPGNITAAGPASPITVTGLTNGTTYTFTVRAVNLTGSSAASAVSNAVTPTASTNNSGGSSPTEPANSSGDSSTEPETSNSPAGVEFLVNGKVEKIGTATTAKVKDQTVTTVVVDPKVLERKLATEEQHAVIMISVNTKSDVVIGEISGQIVKIMEQKAAVIVVKTENATYTLPAEQINISGLSEQFGKNVQLQDIKITVEISKPAMSTVKLLEEAAAKGGFTLVAPALNFTVRGAYGDSTVDVSKFNAYVERTIVIPKAVNSGEIVTGVVVEPDGAIRPVPTQLITVDGKSVARVSSLTNSTYSIVRHQEEYKDMGQHWAKNAVNEMGLRMVVNGIDDHLFQPDQAITWAELAAILVRGLGLKMEGGSTAFADVKTTDWYSSLIQTAYAYKLISGYEDGSFRPNDIVTREQAMVMIAKAMKITNLKAKLPVQSTDATLRPYTDTAAASSWALSSIADSIQAEVVSGRESNELAPKGKLTRAEA